MSLIIEYSMDKRVTIFIILSLLLVSPLWAVTKKVGPYTIDVDILNSAQYTIPSGKLSCDYWGKQVYVKISAVGYKSIEWKFTAGSGQTYFKRVVQLADEEKVFKAIDLRQRTLQSVYFDKTQFGADPNFYQLKAYIPIKDWPTASAKNVDIYDDFWGVFLKKSCTIDKIEDFYQVTMTMTRKALANTATRLYVVFNTAKPATPTAARRWVSAFRKAEHHRKRIPAEVISQSADFLMTNVAVDDLKNGGAANSPILTHRIKEAEKFEIVHQVPHLPPESLLQFGN